MQARRGYLLKDRVLGAAEFTDTVRRVAAGGTAMDPEVISRLLARNSGNDTVAALSPREREVLEPIRRTLNLARGVSASGTSRNPRRLPRQSS